MLIATLNIFLFIVLLTNTLQYIKKGTRKMFPRDVDQEVVVHSSFPFRHSPTLNLLPKFKAAKGRNFL